MNNDKTPNDRATPRTEATFNALVDAFVSYDKKQLYFSDLANACYVAKCDFQDVERELTEAKAARDDALIAVDSWVAECKELRVEAERLKARNQRLLSACKGSLKDQRHLNDVAEAVVTERDQLRAEVEQLKLQNDSLIEQRDNLIQTRTPDEEVDQLRARVAELEANGASEAFVTMAIRASTAEQKVAELEADKARLDWLGVNTYDFVGRMRMVEKRWLAGKDSVRAAIDAARKGAT